MAPRLLQQWPAGCSIPLGRCLEDSGVPRGAFSYANGRFEDHTLYDAPVAAPVMASHQELVLASEQKPTLPTHVNVLEKPVRFENLVMVTLPFSMAELSRKSPAFNKDTTLGRPMTLDSFQDMKAPSPVHAQSGAHRSPSDQPLGDAVGQQAQNSQTCHQHPLHHSSSNKCLDAGQKEKNILALLQLFSADG